MRRRARAAARSLCSTRPRSYMVPGSISRKGPRPRVRAGPVVRKKRQLYPATKRLAMRYLHTMLRVRNLDDALDFYCNKLGLKEARRRVDEKNRYTLVFLAGPEDEHLVYEVDDIYATCEKLMKAGVTINRPPRDGNMAFVRSPDKHSIELLQKGNPLPPKEPWKSMPNTGKW